MSWGHFWVGFSHTCCFLLWYTSSDNDHYEQTLCNNSRKDTFYWITCRSWTLTTTSLTLIVVFNWYIYTNEVNICLAAWRELVSAFRHCSRWYRVGRNCYERPDKCGWDWLSAFNFPTRLNKLFRAAQRLSCNSFIVPLRQLRLNEMNEEANHMPHPCWALFSCDRHCTKKKKMSHRNFHRHLLLLHFWLSCFSRF